MLKFIEKIQKYSKSVKGGVENYEGTEASLKHFFGIEEEKEREGLAEAIAYSAKLHKGQTRWDGSPYILHPLRVLLAVEQKYGYDEELMIVAVLHDVVEDCGISPEIIREKFGPTISIAISHLSKNKGESYREYIENIGENPLAVKVKLCDIEDNSRIAGQSGTNKTTAEQGARYAKYAWAYKDLKESLINNK